MSSPPSKTCGSCSLCCKVMSVDDLGKLQGVWCSYFKKGPGCSIHGSHPLSCQAFQCLWLLSPTMPDAVRPDRSKIVFSLDDEGRRIIARCDPDHPNAWRQPDIYRQLKHWSKDGWGKGRTVWAMINRHMWLIAPDQDVDVGETDPRSPFFYETAPNGRITVTVLPPLAEGEDYDPNAVMEKVGRGPPTTGS